MKPARDYDKYNHITMVIKNHPESDIVIPVDKFIRVKFTKENSMREYVIPAKLIKYLLLESLVW